MAASKEEKGGVMEYSTQAPQKQGEMLMMIQLL
jgi:hypothetical protein